MNKKKTKKYHTKDGNTFTVKLNGKTVDVADNSDTALVNEVLEIIRPQKDKLLEYCHEHWEFLGMYMMDVDEMFDDDPEYYTYLIAKHVAFDIWNHIYFGVEYTVLIFNIEVTLEGEVDKSKMKKDYNVSEWGGIGYTREDVPRYIDSLNDLKGIFSKDDITDNELNQALGICISLKEWADKSINWIETCRGLSKSKVEKGLDELLQITLQASYDLSGQLFSCPPSAKDLLREILDKMETLRMDLKDLEYQRNNGWDVEKSKVCKTESDAETVGREYRKFMDNILDILFAYKLHESSYKEDLDEALYELQDVIRMDYDAWKSEKSVTFKNYKGTWQPIAKAGHYTMWKCNEEPNAYNIITQTKKNSKTGKLVEKIVIEDVDGFEDKRVAKTGLKKDSASFKDDIKSYFLDIVTLLGGNVNPISYQWNGDSVEISVKEGNVIPKEEFKNAIDNISGSSEFEVTYFDEDRQIANVSKKS